MIYNIILGYSRAQFLNFWNINPQLYRNKTKINSDSKPENDPWIALIILLIRLKDNISICDNAKPWTRVSSNKYIRAVAFLELYLLSHNSAMRRWLHIFLFLSSNQLPSSIFQWLVPCRCKWDLIKISLYSIMTLANEKQSRQQQQGPKK